MLVISPPLLASASVSAMSMGTMNMASTGSLRSSSTFRRQDGMTPPAGGGGSGGKLPWGVLALVAALGTAAVLWKQDEEVPSNSSPPQPTPSVAAQHPSPPPIQTSSIDAGIKQFWDAAVTEQPEQANEEFFPEKQWKAIEERMTDHTHTVDDLETLKRVLSQGRERFFPGRKSISTDECVAIPACVRLLQANSRLWGLAQSSNYTDPVRHLREIEIYHELTLNMEMPTMWENGEKKLHEMRVEGMFPLGFNNLMALCDTWPLSANLVDSMLRSGLGVKDIFAYASSENLSTCPGLAERLSYEDEVPCKFREALCWELLESKRLGEYGAGNTDTE